MKIKTYINHSFEVSKKIAFQNPKQSYEIAEENGRNNVKITE